MRFKILTILAASSIALFSSSHGSAVKKALSEFGEKSPTEAAADRFSQEDFRFIFYAGFSVHAPGDFQLGSDLIFKRYPHTLLPTNDTPQGEEVEIFKTAWGFAKQFNEKMLSLLIEANQIGIFEIEYEVVEDSQILITYHSSPNTSLSLREKKGTRRVLWVESIDSIDVKNGKIEILRTGKIDEFTANNKGSTILVSVHTIKSAQQSPSEKVQVTFQVHEPVEARNSTFLTISSSTDRSKVRSKFPLSGLFFVEVPTDFLSKLKEQKSERLKYETFIDTGADPRKISQLIEIPEIKFSLFEETITEYEIKAQQDD